MTQAGREFLGYPHDGKRLILANMSIENNNNRRRKNYGNIVEYCSQNDKQH